MEKYISVFDMYKVGVGPSSSHTLGPWMAAKDCLTHLDNNGLLSKVLSIQISLYGSLAKTGKGHGTDMAVMMGLMGEDPIVTDTSLITLKMNEIKSSHSLKLKGEYDLLFIYDDHIQFLKDQRLPHHPNALTFTVKTEFDTYTFTYYSIGGGFIEKEASNSFGNQDVSVKENAENGEVPFSFLTTEDLLHWCMKTGMPIFEVILENEKTMLSQHNVEAQLDHVWETMLDCIYKGCHTEGILPGGLQVRRRAFELNKKLLKDKVYQNKSEWLQLIKTGGHDFNYILDWVSCFALAVNEENASFGRVVTAPTNGAAGVVPAVLLYALLFTDQRNEGLISNEELIRHFLCTSSAVGILFKNGATISAAMGGCQAEIGVSSAMAAAGLTEWLGGTQKQCLMAAEIAMEHHLGLTCDPVGGLVQIPCIERNTMGAIKAITAAQLALQSTPDFAVVSLDKVIHTMWNTALDMNAKYKETADGGLATQISIALAEC
jgi:L-serine dehydratase